jgi:hypothetical protein
LSNKKWLEFYEGFKKYTGCYPSSSAKNILKNTFSKLKKLQSILENEKSIIQDNDIVKSILGIPYDYTSIKAAEAVKNKFKKENF